MSRQHRSTHRYSKRRSLFLVMLMIGVGIVMLAGIYALGRWYESCEYHEERQQMSENFGELHTVEYDGKRYLRRPEVTTLLVMGVDRENAEETKGFRNGGQADFLLLLALDHENRQIHQLQVDRDAITEVPIVGVLGNDAGTRRMQICLAHSYGGTEEDRCRHTVQALANLLGGETAEHYLAVRLDAIGVLNTALGGLTVTIPEDYSNADPAMTKGAVLTLTDEQAEILVRSRMTVGDGTNASRMVRQRTFMTAAIERIRTGMSTDAEFVTRLVETLDQTSATSMERGWLINEANRVYKYDILPAETLAGEYKIGTDGFMEFHADEDAIVAWLLKTLYEPKN